MSVRGESSDEAISTKPTGLLECFARELQRHISLQGCTDNGTKPLPPAYTEVLKKEAFPHGPSMVKLNNNGIHQPKFTPIYLNNIPPREAHHSLSPWISRGSQ